MQNLVNVPPAHLMPNHVYAKCIAGKTYLAIYIGSIEFELMMNRGTDHKSEDIGDRHVRGTWESRKT